MKKLPDMKPNNLESKHTGWYDLAMINSSASKYVCLLSTIMMLQQSAFADDIPLRPSINTDKTSQNTDSTLKAQENSSSASDAVTDDFNQHKISSPTIKSSPPPQQVKEAKSNTVLKNGSAESVGPSQSMSKKPAIDEIQLQRPALTSLITINDYLNPFQLDASNSSSVTLRRALELAINQNLALKISRTNTKQKEYAYYSSLGNFLPNATGGFSEYFVKGQISLPSAASSLFSSAAAGGTPRSGSLNIHSPFEIMHAGLEYYAYRGGSILFGAQQAKHNLKAAEHQEKASLSDTLMSVTKNYYNLVLAETLLQIRIDAVKTSTEQLRRNLDRFHSGLATNLDVMQSRTQLSRDRQNLVDQQTNRRAAAISLAVSLNVDLGQDLIPVDLLVKKTRLIDPRLNIADILQIAIDNRPELKQYEELRIAAKKAIMVSAANLQPTVLLTGQAYGIGPPSNLGPLGVFAVNVNWRLRGFGTVDANNVQQSRWTARQTVLQSQQELQTIMNDVRNSYLQILDKERNIEESSAGVQS
ncbi:MAG: TolC family protein, partial [Candidatus Obscuribacterales bacterium]|nr:TolC family protein [Candidatus Obscuribacterales bacterium]